MINITALIPAYNEAPRLGNVIKPLLLVPEIKQIIVVDDGSTDNTSLVALSYHVENIGIPHSGKAAAIRAGLELARYPFVLTLDADLTSLQPRHIRNMIAAAQNADEVIGVFYNHLWFLSGVRLLPTTKLIQATAKAHGYSIEVVLNKLAEKEHWRVVGVSLTGVGHVTKERKWGFDQGFRERLKLMGEVTGEILRK